jgi:translation elongation factor EF-4
VSNFYKAFDADLKIVPVINKIDAQAADVTVTEEQLIEILDFDLEEILLISAKTGLYVHKVFEAIIDRIPAPPIPESNALKAFLFDARFLPNFGVACLVKIMQGKFTAETVKQLISYHNGKRYDIYEVGIVQPKLVKTSLLNTG